MMSEPVSFSLGDTAVSIFTISHLLADLADWYRLPPEEGLRPLPLPVQSILIQQAGRVLLVDAPRHDIAADSIYAIPGYTPPPGLVEQLAQAGVIPDDVTHVVITHPHFDHFNGLTAAGKALFPQARHYLARADWESAYMKAKLKKPASLESKTFGYLQQQGLLELVNGTADLGGGVQILPAPGETPGHQIVRLAAEGQVLYCVGDLFHHELELRRPGTTVHWADPAAMANSQQQLLAAALAEDALLAASHIGGYGRVRQTERGLIWQAA